MLNQNCGSFILMVHGCMMSDGITSFHSTFPFYTKMIGSLKTTHKQMQAVKSTQERRHMYCAAITSLYTKLAQAELWFQHRGAKHPEWASNPGEQLKSHKQLGLKYSCFHAVTPAL